MTHLYEGMFVLDNAVVRQGWKAAKAIVTDILTKHEANTITARRWDERRLAYNIKGRGRATFMICYFELPKDAGAALNRSLELNESVLRYLITRVEAVPATEADLAAREESDDFVVPAPPVEEAAVIVAEEETKAEGAKGKDAKGDDAAKDSDGGDSEGADAKGADSESSDSESADSESSDSESTDGEAVPADTEAVAASVAPDASTEESKTDEGA